MRHTTTEIRGAADGNTCVVLKPIGGYWRVTYIAKSFDYGYNDFTRGQLFKTIKLVKDAFVVHGLTYESDKPAILSSGTNRDYQRRYVQNRKKFKNKRLSVWLTPVDFKKLKSLQESFDVTGTLGRVTNETLISYLISKEYDKK